MSRDDGGSLLWPTVFAALGTLVLVSLGTWQMNRKSWKDGLIAQIEARSTAAPIPLADAVRRLATGEDIEYLRVRANGRLMPGREAYYWAPATSGPGWHVYAPLETADGAILIVNRGFVAEAFRDPAKRPEPQPNQSELVGLLRHGERKGAFAATNDPVRSLWYWRDLEGMGRAMLGPAATKALPFSLDVERGPEGGTTTPRTPRGGTTRLAIPNNHLQYAMTWYGLAATLIGVYGALFWSRRPSRQGQPNTDT